MAYDWGGVPDFAPAGLRYVGDKFAFSIPPVCGSDSRSTHGGPPMLRFALPGGSIPQARIMPRAGPIFCRSREVVRVTETQDGDFVLDSNGDEEQVEVDVVDASPAVLTSISRVSDGDARVQGFKAFGADDVDGLASIAVWPFLQDLLDISGSYVDRPTTAYEPEDFAIPPRGSSWAIVGDGSDVYATGASGSDHAPGVLPRVSHSLPIGAPPAAPSVPVIPGLDPAEVAQALQSGVSRADLDAFARVAFTVPPATRPPLLGSRSPANLGRQYPPNPLARPPTQTRPAPAPPVMAAPPDFFAQLAEALQQGLRPEAAESSPLERALAGLGGGSLDTDGAGSLRRQGRARLLLCQALSDDPSQFSGWVDRALSDAFPSRPANAHPTMREYVEHRSRFSSSHRPTPAHRLVGGRRPRCLAQRTPRAGPRPLGMLMVALEQISIDGRNLLMAQELLWEPEPPTIAYNASTAETSWRKPCSALCAPEWAEVAFARLRDLDDWALRKQRLTNMGPWGKGLGKGKPTNTEGHGGAAALDGPAVLPAKRRAKAKPKGKAKAPGGG